MPTRRRVCIVGGGSSGLAALHELLEADFDAVLFEARSHVGGAWSVYPVKDDCTVSWEHSAATGRAYVRGTIDSTPMYTSLRANVPTVSLHRAPLPKKRH